MPGPLTLEDIVDLRAYEREREEFRARIIDLKRRRRIGVGPFVTLVFENADTVRFQIQEMARAERMLSDEAIQVELDTYNPLVPGPGQLSATLFVELTSEPALREWLPRLVGIERSGQVIIGAGSPSPLVIGCAPEEGHAAQLTRSEMTASVHYVRWELDPPQIDAFAAGPVAIGIDHPAYSHQTLLSDDSLRELLGDLRPQI